MRIFTDASTSPQKQIAVGVFLCLSIEQVVTFAELSAEILTRQIANLVVYNTYESKKSTWSEIKTIILALESLGDKTLASRFIKIYTDCQSACDLLERRKKLLEKNSFRTRTGKVIANADLYKELFSKAEGFQIEMVKVKGHASASKRVSLEERIFAILDKLCRRKLRELLG